MARSRHSDGHLAVVSIFSDGRRDDLHFSHDAIQTLFFTVVQKGHSGGFLNINNQVKKHWKILGSGVVITVSEVTTVYAELGTWHQNTHNAGDLETDLLS